MGTGDVAKEQHDAVQGEETRVQSTPAAPAGGVTQEFLTPEEAAALLRVNVGTLYEMLKTSRPPWAKQIGKQHRISRTALLKWFEQDTAGAPKKRRML